MTAKGGRNKIIFSFMKEKNFFSFLKEIFSFFHFFSNIGFHCRLTCNTRNTHKCCFNVSGDEIIKKK